MTACASWHRNRHTTSAAKCIRSGTSGPPTFSACGRQDIDPFQVARTLDLPHSFAIADIPKWVQAKSTDWTHSQQEITEKD